MLVSLHLVQLLHKIITRRAVRETARLLDLFMFLLNTLSKNTLGIGFRGTVIKPFISYCLTTSLSIDSKCVSYVTDLCIFLYYIFCILYISHIKKATQHPLYCVALYSFTWLLQICLGFALGEYVAKL